MEDDLSISVSSYATTSQEDMGKYVSKLRACGMSCPYQMIGVHTLLVGIVYQALTRGDIPLTQIRNTGLSTPYEKIDA